MHTTKLISGVCAALLAALPMSGCKKEGGGATRGAPIATTSTDALWQLAPADLDAAVVVADGALAPMHAGALMLLASAEKVPGANELVAQARAAARVGKIDWLDPVALAAAGIDLTKGAAFFASGDGATAVLPVGDRAKLVAALGARSENGIDLLSEDMACKELASRYVCARTLEALADLPTATKPLVASWPAEMRGAIEAFVGPRLAANVNLPIEDSKGIRVAAVLERGAVTLRAQALGTPRPPLQPSAPSRLVTGAASSNPTGVLALQLAPYISLLTGDDSLNRLPQLPGGVSGADLVRSLSGDLVVYTPPGAPLRATIKVGLVDPAPMKKLLGACGQIAAMAPPGVTLTGKGERCSVVLDPKALAMAGPMPMALPPVPIELSVEAGALSMAIGDHSSGSTAGPAPAGLGKEIIEGRYAVAFWGYGSITSAPMTLPAEVGDKAPVLLWVIHHLCELGIAAGVTADGIEASVRVRTTWANPDPLVAELETRILAIAGGNADAFADASALADKYPDSPFASDTKAGAGGLLLPAVSGGVLAGVSIPAFMKYTKKSKSTEARTMLHKLYDGARAHYIDGLSTISGVPGFPTPNAGPTPPPGSCCQGPDYHCAPDPSHWAAAPWKSLKFSVDDPHLYSYQYEAAPDGKSFTVRAIGDLDCDGDYSTFQMTGRVGADGEIAATPELERINDLE